MATCRSPLWYTRVISNEHDDGYMYTSSILLSPLWRFVVQPSQKISARLSPTSQPLERWSNILICFSFNSKERDSQRLFSLSCLLQVFVCLLEPNVNIAVEKSFYCQVDHTALVTCTVGLRHTKVQFSYMARYDNGDDNSRQIVGWLFAIMVKSRFDELPVTGSPVELKILPGSEKWEL